MYIKYTIHIEVIYNGWMVYLHWKWTHIAIVLDQSSGSGGEGCPVPLALCSWWLPQWQTYKQIYSVFLCVYYTHNLHMLVSHTQRGNNLIFCVYTHFGGKFRKDQDDIPDGWHVNSIIHRRLNITSEWSKTRLTNKHFCYRRTLIYPDLSILETVKPIKLAI